MVALPTVAFALYGLCNADGCTLVPPAHTLTSFAAFWKTQTFLSWEAAGVVAAWLAAQLLVFWLMPGTVHRGLPLEDGSYYTYKLNGLSSFLFFTVALAVGQARGWIDLAFCHHHFLELLTTTFLLVLVLSVYVYLYSFRTGERLAHGGNTGMGPSQGPSPPPPCALAPRMRGMRR